MSPTLDAVSPANVASPSPPTRCPINDAIENREYDVDIAVVVDDDVMNNRRHVTAVRIPVGGQISTVSVKPASSAFT